MEVDRKQWILAAAARSFALFGYKATTMDQVAKIAGVGKGTIYTFFTTKEELFDAIMAKVIQEMREVADDSLGADGDVRANFEELLFKLLEFRRQHELLIRLSHEIREMGTPAATEAMNKLEEAIVTAVKAKVQEAIDRGLIKPCDPEIAAFVMVKLYVALVYEWEKRRKPLEKEQISEMIKLSLFEGLAVRS